MSQETQSIQNSSTKFGSVQSIHIEMLKRCQRKDQSAQIQVYHLYYKAMYNTSLRIVKNTAEAEDVMQESFLIAFERIISLEDLSVFSAWLKRIVVNKSINSLKQHTSYESLKEQGHSEEAEQEVSFRMPFTVDAVKSAMNQLADGYRLVLSLYLFEGYDHEEIAQILGITSSTSRSQYNRGRQQLKQLLTQHFAK